MGNRFKAYIESHRKNTQLTEEEVNLYANTVGNIGVDHDRAEWEVQKTQTFVTDEDETEINSDKERTVQRNSERTQKDLEREAPVPANASQH